MANKEYRQIKVRYGCELHHAVNALLEYRSRDELVSLTFNNVTLYSDTVKMDQAYKDVTGLTKSEFDKRYKLP